jgi:hypothetical protein
MTSAQTAVSNSARKIFDRAKYAPDRHSVR